MDNDSVLDIVLCTVRVPARARSGVGLKEAAKHKFEIMTPGKKKPIVFAAETEGDRKEWVAAIQEAISQSLNSQARLYSDRVLTHHCTRTRNGACYARTKLIGMSAGSRRGAGSAIERRVVGAV